MALIKPSARQVKFCVTGAQHTHPNATVTDPGFMAPADKVKLDGLSILQVATTTILGGIKSGGDIVVSAEGIVTVVSGGGGEEVPYSKQVDFIDDDHIYIGEAAPGTAFSTSIWRIKYIVIAGDGDVSTTWADGDSDFDKVWNDRLTYSYS